MISNENEHGKKYECKITMAICLSWVHQYQTELTLQEQLINT